MATMRESFFTCNTNSESDVCSGMEMEEITNKQLSATGFISYMNCVGVGLPFLTYNFNVNKEFLKRHNLKLCEVYTMRTPSREILLDAIQEFGVQLKDVPVTPGGLGMDIARIAQWLQPQAKSVAFLGARAADEESTTLRNLCKHTRMAVRLEEVAGSRTAVLLIAHLKQKWCEVLFIDNMACISVSYIDKPIVTKMLERSNMIYITGMSVLMNPHMTLKVAYYAFSRFKHCILVLHRAQFLECCKDTLHEILSNVDILFLNPKGKIILNIVFLTVRCAAKLIAIYNIPQKYHCCSDCKNAWDIYLWLKAFAKKSSVVIVSDGLATAYVHTDLNIGMSAKYKSRFMSKCKVVDYNGAARAFVGGFMAMMIRGYQIDPCVECGFFCTSVIVGKLGVQIPEDDELMNQWYILLDHILERRDGQQTVKRRESSMPFTMFQTPWKERDVNAMFGPCETFSPDGATNVTAGPPQIILVPTECSFLGPDSKPLPGVDRAILLHLLGNLSAPHPQAAEFVMPEMIFNIV